MTKDIENAKLEKRGKAGDEEAQLERIKVQREELLQVCVLIPVKPCSLLASNRDRDVEANVVGYLIAYVPSCGSLQALN